jgi:hypothetical protein
MTTESMYPPAAPSITGNTISLDLFLRSPARVRRVLENLSSQRFIADRIFAAGNADGGAVIYDRVTEQDLYTDRDTMEITPGSEFPTVGASAPEPEVARVVKRGGQVQVTYEAVRRDDRDVVRRALTKLSNTLIKQHDQIAVNALIADADVLTDAASDEFNDTNGDPYGDILTAVNEVEQADLGYAVDTVLLNPQERLTIMLNSDIRQALPRENTAVNPLLSGQLAGLCGIPNWVVSNRVPAGSMIFLNSGIVGSMRDEVGLYTRTIDKQETETWLIQAARVSVPVITDPKAAFVLTGCYKTT